MAAARRTTKKAAPRAGRAAKAPAAKPAAAAVTLAEAMRALEAAGTAQTRKTYARHGAAEPMFGVSFAVMKTLVRRIGVDQGLARALWDTGNADARTLAVKVADPVQTSPDELDRWARESTWHVHADYVAQLAGEGPHGHTQAVKWLAKSDEREGRAGWTLVGDLALRRADVPDAWFHARLAEIEARIASAPNLQKEAMNRTLIAIGGRSAALRAAAIATAKRIGPVEVDHGETSCKTPDPRTYIEKMWEHAKAKGFATPAEQERRRESPRCRC